MALLHNGRGGTIRFDGSLFSVVPPEYFDAQLKDLTVTVSRDKDTGARLLIGHYLVHAVLLARSQFGLDRLVVSSEVEVEPEEVPNLGYLSGNLDFTTCVVTGAGKLGMVSSFLMFNAFR